MSSTQQPGSEQYVLTGLKNVDHLQCDENLEELDLDDPPHLQPNSSNMVVEEEEEIEEYIGDENDVHFMLRLIDAVKESPALYDPMVSKKNPGAKDDAWHRIRNQLIWNGSGSIESVWNSLIDQYADDKDSLDDTIRQSLDWIDRYIEYNKDASPQPDLEKDSYLNDTVQEDVMISGCRTIASHTGAGYVVVQPQRSRHQSMPSQPQTSTAQHISQTPNRAYVNHHVPNGNVGQPAVRRLVISSHQPNLQPYKRAHPQQLQTVKKEDSNGVTTMMVDMTTYYDNGNGQKLYRLMQVPQNGQRQYHIQQRQTNNIEYDLPPEPLIEGTPEQQPPRKKMTIPQMITTTSTTSTSTIQSNNRVEDNRIVAGGVPIADDEIIDDGIQESTIVIDPDGHLHEESPLLNSSPDVMISGQSTRHQQNLMSEQKMGGLVSAQIPSTSAAQVPHVQHHHHHHHHHHQHQQQPQPQQQQQGHISRSGRPEEVVDDPVETATAEILEQQNQYDADLQFQQLISSHLSRLSDDDKAIMKYQMQRILLDARFGDGTAKHLMPDVEILEGDEVVHAEQLQPVNQSANQQQSQQEKRFTN